MKNVLRASTTIALWFVFAVAADAAELFSAPLKSEGDNLFDCRIVNVGSSTRTVTIEIFEENGTFVTDKTTTLGPGQGDDRGTSVNGNFYCKFTVQGGKTQYRASASVRGPDGAVAALPAN
jgi:hypothetical protein